VIRWRAAADNIIADNAIAHVDDRFFVLAHTRSVWSLGTIHGHAVAMVSPTTPRDGASLPHLKIPQTRLGGLPFREEGRLRVCGVGLSGVMLASGERDDLSPRSMLSPLTE